MTISISLCARLREFSGKHVRIDPDDLDRALLRQPPVLAEPVHVHGHVSRPAARARHFHDAQQQQARIIRQVVEILPRQNESGQILPRLDGQILRFPHVHRDGDGDPQANIDCRCPGLQLDRRAVRHEATLADDQGVAAGRHAIEVIGAGSAARLVEALAASALERHPRFGDDGTGLIGHRSAHVRGVRLCEGGRRQRQDGDGSQLKYPQRTHARHEVTPTCLSRPVITLSESKNSSAIARAAVECIWYSRAIMSAPRTASSSVRNGTRPRPVGYRWPNPVSWTSAGFPDARYRTVRSLNQPDCGLHVYALRHRELGAGFLDVAAERERIAGYRSGVDQPPSVLVHRLDVSAVGGIDGERDLERLRRRPRQRRELSEFVRLQAVPHPVAASTGPYGPRQLATVVNRVGVGADTGGQ